MENLTASQRARIAIRNFKTTADALSLRGYYKPSGQSGQTLEMALRGFSPEIYGSMNDPSINELKGLEYVIDRLPRGIELCTRIILTADENMDHTSFEKIEPLKRRRTSYRLNDKEMCFVITRGLSEIYDVLTHLTFLNIESEKICKRIHDDSGKITKEWRTLEEDVLKGAELKGTELDRAIWNLSMILGRTYHETQETYEYLEKNRKEFHSNTSLFEIIYGLGKKRMEEELNKENEIVVYFTPSLREMIGHHKYASIWAKTIKEKLISLGLEHRPLHIISANMHSIINALYAYAYDQETAILSDINNLYEYFSQIRDRENCIKEFAKSHGLIEVPDQSGTHIDCQILDTSLMKSIVFHPEFRIDKSIIESDTAPVILVMDYAFGTQAFEVMDELIVPYQKEDIKIQFQIDSISIMGKAGILPGKKGDIMLATAHVLEGTPNNYIVQNDLCRDDFDSSVNVYVGVIVTVLGTSLQNRDVLHKFQTTSWNAVGLEMEGGHYQRAINAAIIRGHIRQDVKVRYAYYASDNPLMSGQTLASGSMGKEGIKPTYMISKVILEKILNS
ncbi:MAG: hypothetical protein HQK77_10020 [Desulfobacterales bacterium]|nr:hypothetical protein [Desulfobacterales bacterium]